MKPIRLLAALLMALTLSSVGAAAHACEGMGQPHEGQAQMGSACPSDGMKHRAAQGEAAQPCCNPAACDATAHHDPHACCIDPAKNGHPPAAAAPSDGAQLDLDAPVAMVVAALPLPRPAFQPAVVPALRTPPPSSGVGSARLIC